MHAENNIVMLIIGAPERKMRDSFIRADTDTNKRMLQKQTICSHTALLVPERFQFFGSFKSTQFFDTLNQLKFCFLCIFVQIMLIKMFKCVIIKSLETALKSSFKNMNSSKQAS